MALVRNMAHLLGVITMELRPLGQTDLMVSVVALGCWPIAGMTSPGVNDEDSIATIRACFDLGINHLDTAFNYGRNGESERLIARGIEGRRDEMVIATKGGLCWGPDGKLCHDATPATLRRHCEESLARLRTDRLDLYYLHAPDPHVPLAESAGAIRDLMAAGKVRAAGISNVTVPQLEEFSATCPLAAYQPPYNMIQRQVEEDTLPWCRAHGVSVLVYWPLAKGLLAGALRRTDELAPGDNRRKYPMFHGDEWQKNHDLVDKLRPIAAESGHTVAQLVINWTILQPGITSALCGAKRPAQVRDNAGAAGWRLSEHQLAQIKRALAERGTPLTKTPV
jgi:aryl-alcohol dehydrogenase-like predicted oxidoreductase